MPSSTTIAADAGAPRRVRKLARRLQRGDQIAHLITFIFAATIFIITALLFYELYTGALLTRQKFGWSFLSGTTWDPVALEFGALPFIYGTLVTSALALIIGGPFGCSARAARSVARPRCDAVGNHMECRCALRESWNHRLHFPRSGPRAGRNDGRHDGHRERSEDQFLLVCSGLLHCRSYCE